MYERLEELLKENNMTAYKLSKETGILTATRGRTVPTFLRMISCKLSPTTLELQSIGCLEKPMIEKVTEHLRLKLL